MKEGNGERDRIVLPSAKIKENKMSNVDLVDIAITQTSFTESLVDALASDNFEM